MKATRGQECGFCKTIMFSKGQQLNSQPEACQHSLEKQETTQAQAPRREASGPHSPGRASSHQPAD